MFQSKKIDFETVGEIFAFERDRKKYTRKYIAEKIQVRETYITILEEGRYLELPALVYSRNFVREYLRFLQLDEKLLHRFEHEMHLMEQTKNKQATLFKTPTGTTFMTWPFFLRVFAGVLVVGSFLFYIGVSVYHVLSPPRLVLLYPRQDVTVDRQLVEIIGATDTNAHVTINDEDILVDEQGQFQDRIPLQPGTNFLTVISRKKYSQPQIIERQIMVRE